VKSNSLGSYCLAPLVVKPQIVLPTSEVPHEVVFIERLGYFAQKCSLSFLSITAILCRRTPCGRPATLQLKSAEAAGKNQTLRLAAHSQPVGRTHLKAAVLRSLHVSFSSFILPRRHSPRNSSIRRRRHCVHHTFSRLVVFDNPCRKHFLRHVCHASIKCLRVVRCHSKSIPRFLA